MQAGHAKKLVPIILSLDRYDNNPAAWQPLKERVEQMTIGLDNLIRALPEPYTCRLEKLLTSLNGGWEN